MAATVLGGAGNVLVRACGGGRRDHQRGEPRGNQSDGSRDRARPDGPGHDPLLGATSGAHLNPAVSIAFATRGDFPWRRVPGYIIAQLVGATLACLLLKALSGNAGMLGATEPGPGVGDWQALTMEFVLTAGLVSTILGTASRAQNLGPISAFGVGAYIILAGTLGKPDQGASRNPARSFGPDLVLWTSPTTGSISWVRSRVGCLPSAWPTSCEVVGSGIQAAEGRLEEIVVETSAQADKRAETK